MRLLLERGADPNVRDEGDDAFPLHFAAENQDLPVIELLLAHGADPIGTGDGHELDVIGWATCWDYVTVQPDVLACLLAHGARHHLFSAVAVGDVDAIRAAAAADPASLTRVMDRHQPAPDRAAPGRSSSASPTALDALLALGADPDARDQAGLTALDQAALAGEAAMAAAAHRARRAPRSAGRRCARPRRRRRAPRRRGSAAASRRAARWGTLIVRAAERAPASVIEALVRLGASVDAMDAAGRRSTASHATPRSTPRRGTATPAPPTRCCASAPTRGSATASTSATPAGWADFAGHRATCDRILEADIDVFDAIACGTPARVAAILDADPAALARPLGLRRRLRTSAT